MSSAVKVLTVVDLLFIFLLSIAGFFSQMKALYGVAYVLAYALPLLLALLAAPKFKRRREEMRGLVEPQGNYFTMTWGGVRDFLPLVIPTVAVIFAISYLTGLLLGAFGLSNAQDYSQRSVLSMMVEQAAVPAVLEELLFRFVPLLLIKPYCKRSCILLSALYFSMAHASLFSMPYAFAAGIIFMAVDVAFDSVIPSVLLHAVNNAASILWMKLCTPENPVSVWIFLGILVIGTAVSLAVILVRRKRYVSMLRESFSRSERISIYAPFIVLAVGIAGAALNLA